MPTWLKRATAETYQLLKKRPLFFILVQFPLVVVELLLQVNGDWLRNQQTYLITVACAALLWLLFFTANFCVQGVTLIEVLRQKNPGSRLSSKGLNLSDGQLSRLLFSGVVVGFVVLLGLSAFIVPGVIIFALYLYVPGFAIVTNNAPMGALLKRSWNLSRENWKMTATILLVFGVVLTISFLIQDLSSNLVEGAWKGIDPIDLLFSLVVGAILHVWVAVLFAQALEEKL